MEFTPDTFFVEEITSDGVILELGKAYSFEKPAPERDFFTHFVLQKREWNTVQALGAIARNLHVKPSRFDFAGTKDRQATTTQLCSVFALPAERLLQARVKDVQINGAWKADAKVRLGNLLGNRFTIKTDKPVNPVASFSNYFGEQRFGSGRKNTAKIGKLILQGDYEAAVRSYLCDSEGEENVDAVRARETLLGEGDFAAAAVYFPHHLKYEITMLRSLSSKPTDFIAAIRALPRSLQLMFVHAFQSDLFNKRIDLRLPPSATCGRDAHGFPSAATEGTDFTLGNVIGYSSVISEDERILLEAEGLSQEAFRLKAMPELSAKGTLRLLEAPVMNFENVEGGIRFALPKGCYATVAVKYILNE
ncbi:putative tRNA pseudouridine synthase D [Candidatus Norongarragalina meridionalis]|nr:putative tRNA pseudouridine synthase D [Candidatus Norongarragalina meridionalis]